MRSRSSRHLSRLEAETLVKELESTHRQLCTWLAKVPISSPIYVALDGSISTLVISIKAARREADIPELPSNRY